MQFGIFVDVCGGGRSGPGGAPVPLPVREQGRDEGVGRAAGSRVQLADWAHVAEMYAERANIEAASYAFAAYPHNLRQTLSQWGVVQGVTDYPGAAARLADGVRTVRQGMWYLPDDAPGATHDEAFWNLPGAGQDYRDHLYIPVTPYIGNATAGATFRPRRVRDVRCMFWDLKNMSRLAGNGATQYGAGGQWGWSAPQATSYGGNEPQGTSGATAASIVVPNGGLPALLGLHPAVTGHADFRVSAAYAVVQLRMQVTAASAPVEDHGRWKTLAFALGAQRGTLDLSAAGCDDAGVIAYMKELTGSSFDPDRGYVGSAEAMAWMFDVRLPGDGAVPSSWTWTPDES